MQILCLLQIYFISFIIFVLVNINMVSLWEIDSKCLKWTLAGLMMNSNGRILVILCWSSSLRRLQLQMSLGQPRCERQNKIKNHCSCERKTHNVAWKLSVSLQSSVLWLIDSSAVGQRADCVSSFSSCGEACLSSLPCLCCGGEPLLQCELFAATVWNPKWDAHLWKLHDPCRACKRLYINRTEGIWSEQITAERKEKDLMMLCIEQRG